MLDGLRVLIVDDDSDSREVLAIELAFRGAQTKTAATVNEALELWDRWKPNVLVSDIGMPVEDGYDLIRRVRARDGGQIPAIALTGYASSEDGARVLAAGYQLHLAKPLEPNRLVEAIAGFAENRETSRSGSISYGG
jgi:CheY-like chemotaxis protein